MFGLLRKCVFENISGFLLVIRALRNTDREIRKTISLNYVLDTF